MRTLLKKLSLGLLLVVTFQCSAQFNDANIEWQTVFTPSSSSHTVLRDNISLSDGSIVAVGEAYGLQNLRERSFVVSKFNENGAIVWETLIPAETIPLNGNFYQSLYSIKQTQEGFIIGGQKQYDAYLAKVDSNGTLLWEKRFSPTVMSQPGFNSTRNIINDILVGSDGYVVVGYKNSNNYTDTTAGFENLGQAWLMKTDFQGNIINEYLLGPSSVYSEEFKKISLSSDGNYLISGLKNYFNGIAVAQDWFLKVSPQGNVLWESLGAASVSLRRGLELFELDTNQVISFSNSWNQDMGTVNVIIHDITNNTIVENQLFTSEESELADVVKTQTGFLLAYYDKMVKINSQGQKIWDYKFNRIRDGVIAIASAVQTPDNKYVFSGVPGLVFKVGEPDNFLKGTVFIDSNENCINDNNTPFMNRLIKATTGTTDYFAESDSNGSFSIPVWGTGIFTVSPVLQWFLGHPICYTGTNVTITDTTLNIDGGEIPVKILYNCPSLEVSNTAPYLRRCFNNTYYVNYKNIGFTAANNSYVDVILDSNMTFVSSSIPSTDLGNGVRRFDLGTVNGESQGNFNYTIYLACGDSTIIGQTHCVEAHIYPDSACIPVPDTANIVVSSACDGDSIVFRIHNSGNATAPSLRYYVWEDVLLEYQGQTPVIAPNQVIEIRRRNNGQSTYRLETTNPMVSSPYGRLWGASIPSSSIEGCGATGTFNTGFVTRFSTPDDQPWLDIDCQENRGAYDPNDKTGYPLGIGTNHYITANDAIEYKIRFQNTGTDTAFTVIIRDTLDVDLDPSTIQFGASSHPYTAQLYGAGYLKFTFNAINLPDSNVNEPGSNGFVSFKIWQKANNPVGTLINNTASIYFDFNAPIVTNTTQHEINHQNRAFFVGIEENKSASLVGIQVFPNPFEESATMIIGDEKLDHFMVNIYNLAGQVVQSQSYENTNQAIIYRNNLTQGIYIYQIEQKGQILNIGKVVIK